jgi:hypothetical protein
MNLSVGVLKNGKKFVKNPIVEKSWQNIYNTHIMARTESDLPYTTSLETIAGEILKDCGPFDDLADNDRIFTAASALAQKVSQQRDSYKPDLAEDLVESVSPAMMAHGVIAVALLRTEAFTGWQDGNRRHLLDLALTRDIAIHESSIARTMHVIGHIGTSQEEQEVARLTSLRTRLREKGKPTDPRLRR